MSDTQYGRPTFNRNFMLYATFFFMILAISVACWVGGWKVGAIVGSGIFSIISYVVFVANVSEDKIIEHLEKSGIKPLQE